MGNNPSVSVSVEVASSVPAVPYLNHALITFRPRLAAFQTAIINSTQSWVYQDPDTLQGLVIELEPDNWASRLKSLGADDTEPVWLAVDAHFNQLKVADPATGLRERMVKPDKVYCGRRTSAVVSSTEIEFVNNTAGRTRVKVSPAQFLYAGQTPAGSLADVTVESDGALTTAQLATDLAAQLNANADFTTYFSAGAVGAVVTITGLVAGYPLIVDLRTSTPGPTVTQTRTTANVANAYRDDLAEIQRAAETGGLLPVPQRRYYWMTDLQGDDVVNAEGHAWAQAQEAAVVQANRDYLFCAWSTTGEQVITFGADTIGNFDPASTASAAAVAAAANGGGGWTRGEVDDHDRFEFLVPALLGRTIGHLPGEVSFTDKVLYGGTVASRMSPRDHGANETLVDDRHFNWYGAEGSRGSFRYGYLSDGSYKDRKWLEDYARYVVTQALIQFKQLKNIVTYTDDDIKAGAGIIAGALATLPAIIADTIGVASLTRDQVNPANIVARIYFDYTGTGTSGGVINKMGTPSDPIMIVIEDGG